MTNTYKILTFAAFVATIIGANWALDTYGEITVWPWPHLIAPAGVLFAGLAFGLRDALHDLGGHRWVLAAVAAGGALSYVIGATDTIPGGRLTIAAASAVAFSVSELADWIVYTPLRERFRRTGVVASNVVGAAVDSWLFLWLAFGDLDLFWGQVVGKVLMVAVFLAADEGVRRAVPRYRLRAQGA